MSSDSVVPSQPLISATDQISNPVDQTPVEEVGPAPTISSESNPDHSDENGDCVPVPTDNGIFEFMKPDRAIELYKRLIKEGKLDLKWRFHGRKSPNNSKNNAAPSQDEEANAETKDSNQDHAVNTEFDFDEEFSEINDDTSTGESLRFQKRPEAGTEKRTNLSDIMNDIRKEINQENDMVHDQANEGS